MSIDRHVIPRHLDAPILWYWFKPFEAKVLIVCIVGMGVVVQSMYGLMLGVVLGYFFLKKLKKTCKVHGDHILGRWRYFYLPQTWVFKNNEHLPKSHIREFLG